MCQIQRVIMLDADLKFTEDIVLLYNHFNSFTADNVIGIAREGQPVYRHTFWKYRQDHPSKQALQTLFTFYWLFSHTPNRHML